MESLEKKIFGVFIRALWSETDETQYAFLRDFFEQFDLKIDSNHVKNWIDGKNQSYKKKFRSVNCTQDNYKNAFDYLEKIINIRFKNVQSKLKAYSSEYLYIDFDTDDREVFFNSLLNQFMEIVGLPLPSTVVPFVRDEDISEKQKKVPLNETLSNQVRNQFLERVRHFEVMEIINKKPAILNRTDSASLNVFLREMDILLPRRDYHDNALFISIRAFIEKLQIQVLSLDATLNNRFGFEAEDAFINMEEDEGIAKNKKHSKLPKLSKKLLDAASDPLQLLAVVGTGEWGNFRNEMNLMFNNICSWSDKASDV